MDVANCFCCPNSDGANSRFAITPLQVAPRTTILRCATQAFSSFRPYFSATLLGVTAAIAPAWADGNDISDKVKPLPGFYGFSNDIPEVLTTTRLRQPKTRVPGSTTVIEGDLVRQLGINSLVEIFRLVPGMVVAEVGSSTPVTTYRRNIMVIGPSQAYVKAGSLASSYAPYSAVAQALVGALEQWFQEGSLPKPAYPTDFNVQINEQVGRSLNIPLPSEASVKEQVTEPLREQAMPATKDAAADAENRGMLP